MCVVDLSLLFIVEDVVGLLDGFEFDLGGFPFGLRDLVGVACEGGLFASVLEAGRSRPGLSRPLVCVPYDRPSVSLPWLRFSLFLGPLHECYFSARNVQSVKNTVEVNMPFAGHCLEKNRVSKRGLIWITLKGERGRTVEI